MRALVTGCAGFIGSQLAESLVADGHDVVGVDCFLDNYAEADKWANLRALAEPTSFRFTRADLSSAPLEALVEGCDRVFHLAGEPGVRTSWGDRFESYTRNNIVATQRLLEAVRDRDGLRLVYASSSSIYGDAERLPTPEDSVPRPISPYGLTKLAGEHLARVYHANFGVQTVSLRFFSVYGPRQRPDMAFNRFCRAALAGDPVTVYGDGEQTRDFTFVGDIVDACRAAAEAPGAAGEIFNVGGGSRVSINHTLHVLGDLLGRPLDVRRLGPERGDVRDTGADVSKAAARLGYRPSTPFADGLRQELDWILERTPVPVRPDAFV